MLRLITLSFLVLFQSLLVKANEVQSSKAKEGIALSFGLSSLASEPGYSAKIFSPKIFDSSGFFFSFTHQSFSAVSSVDTYDEKSFFIFEPGIYHQFPVLAYLRPYYLIGTPIYSADDLSTENSGGLHFGVGLDLFKYPGSFFAINAEIGYYLSFGEKADKFPQRPIFGQGVSFLIGFKFYLY